MKTALVLLFLLWSATHPLHAEEASSLAMILDDTVWPDKKVASFGSVVLVKQSGGDTLTVQLTPQDQGRQIPKYRVMMLLEWQANALMDANKRSANEANRQLPTQDTSRPTQYNGRPLPRNWIDPKQADQNFYNQQLLQQQQANQAEMRRLQNEMQQLRMQRK